jgi:hypothetical protein
MQKQIESQNDFTEKDTEDLVEFKAKGCPGLTKVKETDIFQWFSLYMSDKTYLEIAQITKSSKNLILYHSDKLGWYDEKMAYYKDMLAKQASKIVATKMKSVDFVTNLLTCWNKRWSDMLNRAIANNNFDEMENIDPKVLAQFFKAIEMLDKLVSPNVSKHLTGAGPTFNINVDGTSQIKKVDNNTIEINSEGAVGKILQELAEIKRISENKDDDSE